MVDTKLDRAPLYKRAYESLRRMISENELAPGQRVTAEELATRLGVSPTPVREAMRMLEQDGLLQTYANEIRVVSLTADDIRKIYFCRSALEVLALRAGIENMTEGDQQELLSHVIASEAAAGRNEPLEFIRHTAAFHNCLTKASGNEWLSLTIAFIRMPLILAHMRKLIDPAGFQRIIQDHRRILGAVLERDVPRATQALEDHMVGDVEWICAHLPGEDAA
jgi:DNA-binding GntR family transcriptional regulator